MKETIEELRVRLADNHDLHEIVARRAYEVYEERGSEPGHDTEHWLQAETEVLEFLSLNESSADMLHDLATSPASHSLKSLTEELNNQTTTSAKSDSSAQRVKKATS